MRDYCEYTKKSVGCTKPEEVCIGKNSKLRAVSALILLTPHDIELTCELTNVTQIFQGAQSHSKLFVIILEEISIHNVYSGHN